MITFSGKIYPFPRSDHSESAKIFGWELIKRSFHESLKANETRLHYGEAAYRDRDHRILGRLAIARSCRLLVERVVGTTSSKSVLGYAMVIRRKTNCQLSMHIFGTRTMPPNAAWNNPADKSNRMRLSISIGMTPFIE